jgi:signal transduction histidine kinase
MLKWITIVLCQLPSAVFGLEKENFRLFFLNLNKLEFENAKLNASRETDSVLQFEMRQLANILYYEGQIDKSTFSSNTSNPSGKGDRTISVLRALNTGYLSLFYDSVKGDAFRNFHKAYQLAKESENPSLIKACLMATLRYFNLEIAQSSDAYLPYLNHLEKIQSDSVDQIWIVLYKLIFYSKSLDKRSLDDYYLKLSESLDTYEKSLDSASPILVHIFYEKGLKYDIEKNLRSAEKYYKKSIAQAMDYPFLRYHRFFANLKLLWVENSKRNFTAAQRYLTNAKKEVDIADTLRSNYHLNLYHAVFLHTQNKNDSAYALLMRVYSGSFQVNFMTNSLVINRLTVELETQEKENANLKLRANRTWLTSALVGVALLFIISYLAYASQRSKNRVQLKEKEMQSMRLEKLLKDHELFGINSMIEGQEKERQRIANDLHDNLGSLLATVKLHFHNLKNRTNSTESEQDLLLQKTDDLIEEAYQRVRSIAHAKNAGVNAQDGLLPAVYNLASKVSILNKLVIDVEEHGMDERLENSLELTIFRMIQELVANVIKHAQATEATIHLTQYDDSINLMVEDNGIGFDTSQIKPQETMGLYSIQKRIENLGGKVTIDSIPQKGTAVIIDIPLT